MPQVLICQSFLGQFRVSIAHKTIAFILPATGLNIDAAAFKNLSFYEATCQSLQVI